MKMRGKKSWTKKTKKEELETETKEAWKVKETWEEEEYENVTY